MNPSVQTRCGPCFPPYHSRLLSIWECRCSKGSVFSCSMCKFRCFPVIRVPAVSRSESVWSRIEQPEVLVATGKGMSNRKPTLSQRATFFLCQTCLSLLACTNSQPHFGLAKRILLHLEVRQSMAGNQTAPRILCLCGSNRQAGSILSCGYS